MKGTGPRHALYSLARRIVTGFDPVEFRRIAVLLAVVLWVAYAINLSTPGLIDRAGQLKGADFLQFYVMGHLAADQAVDVLYDEAAYTSETRRLVPDAVETFPPVYPPHVSVLFEPFSHLSYAWAAIVWSLISISLYALTCGIVWRRCPALRSHRSLVCWLAAGSPAFFNLVAHGQTSSLAAALQVGTLVALLAGRPLFAGLTLGLLVYKPQVGIAAAITLVLSREWRVVIGAMFGAAAALAIGWVHYGTPTMLAYLDILTHPGQLTMIVEQKLYQSHSLRTLWALLIPSRPVALACYALSSAWVLRHTVRYWKSAAPLPRRYAVLLMATVLVSPHVFVYDLVMLAPAFLILADWSLANALHPASAPTRLLLVAAFLSPLLGPLADLTRLQLSVPILLALFHLATQIDTDSNEPALAGHGRKTTA